MKKVEVFMHNCQQMTAAITDLLFGEKNQAVLDEIKHCSRCAAEYAALGETLDVFDQAAGLAMPEAAYWNGYEASLRTKLAAAIVPAQPARQFFSGISLAQLRLVWLLPFFLVVSGLGVSTFFFGRSPESSEIKTAGVRKNQTAQTDGIVPANYNADPQPPRRKRENGRIEKPTRKEGSRAPSKKPFSIFDPHPLALSYAVPPEVSPLETAQNLEKAQLLLRGFRNLPISEDGATFDVADEKSRARSLLQTITKIRRGAEATGNLPLEDTLGSLEPILLDIANLPERPAVDDVQAIKSLMQRAEIVGVLQNYLQSFGATYAVAD